MGNIKNKQSSSAVLLTTFISVIVLASYIVALGKFGNENVEVTSTVSTESSEVSYEVSETVSVEVSEPEQKYKYYSSIKMSNCAFTNDKIYKGNLALLKNKNNITAIDKDALSNVAAVRSSDKYGLRDYSLIAYKDAIVNIDKLILDFYAEVPENGVGILNGYISPEGVDTSKPEIELSTGLSFELTIFTGSYSFSDTEYSFLRDRSYEYGLVERYPLGKEAYTGFDADPSIYRYVGVAHSWYMSFHNLSLEEYIDEIKSKQVLEFESGANNDKGSKYVVYYVPKNEKANTTYVNVPVDSSYKYEVSGDGTDGYIVTVKLP